MYLQDRLEEITAEMLDELKGVNRRLEEGLGKLDERLQKVEKQVQKLNLQTAENSRALIKVVDLLEGEVMARINRLEDTVYKR